MVRNTQSAAGVVWQYKVLATDGLTMAESVLNGLGADGWQLVGIDRGVAYFMRGGNGQVAGNGKPAAKNDGDNLGADGSPKKAASRRLAKSKGAKAVA